MNTFGMKSVLVGLCATALTFVAHATDYTWTGAALDGAKWTTPGNWKVGEEVATSYPGSEGTADTVKIPSGTVSINGEGGTYNLANLTLTAGTAKAQNSVTLTDATLVFSTTSPGNFLDYVNLTFENVSWTAPSGSWFQVPGYGEAVFIGTTVVNLNNASKGLYNMNKTDPRVVFKDGTAQICCFAWNNDKSGTNRNLIEVDNAVVTCTGGFNFGNSQTLGVKPTLKLYNGGRVVANGNFSSSSAYTIDAVLPATGATTPRLSVAGSPSLNYPITFKIDASACEAGSYPIVKATGKYAITLPTGGFSDYTFDITTAEGFVATPKITADNKEIYVEVQSAALQDNEWLTEPSITATSWNAGETAGTISLGEAKFGEVVCNYTQEQINALPAGRYTLSFTVDATATYKGLEKTINIIVMGEDTQAATYTWKSDVASGNWCDPQNWTTDVGVRGYPSNALVRAVIATGNQRRVIDLQGCRIPLTTDVSSNVGLEVSGTGATIRNGSVSVGRFWGGESVITTFENMTIDLNSADKSRYFSLQKLATVTLCGNVSIANGYFNAQGYNDDVTIRDGETYVDGNFKFGNVNTTSGYRSTKGTLAITNATLTVNYDCTFGTAGRTDHVPPVLQLFDGVLVCTNTYKKSGAYFYGKFNMTSSARIELMLTAADKSVPRIAANYANLSNVTFVVKSAERGRYPLVAAKTSLTLPNDSLEGLTLDVSALGKGSSGHLELSDDGKTLSAQIAGSGLMIIVR